MYLVLIVLAVVGMIAAIVASYVNWKRERARTGSDNNYSQAYLNRDKMFRRIFMFCLAALLVFGYQTCNGQSVYVGYNDRRQATVAIDTDACSATIVTHSDTIVLYGDTVTYFRGLVTLKERVSEGHRMLAQICTSDRCIIYPRAVWCDYCGNQRY